MSPQRLVVPGLDREADHDVEMIDLTLPGSVTRTLSGEVLADEGLDGLPVAPLTARIWRIERRSE